MAKKIKLFEDYVKELKFPEDPEILWSTEKLALNNMLNDLAEQIHELDKDNDYLRGWLTELQHKLDFVMEEVAPNIDSYFTYLGKDIRKMNLKELYEQNLKQSKEDV